MIDLSECEPIAPAAATARAQASLRLEFLSSGRHTVLGGSKQQPPLRVVRAFALEDGTALAHLHNVSGGVLSGDELKLVVRVGPGAAAQLTTTGATRVYRAREHDLDAVLVNDVTVEENGLLEYVPDPIIPFAGARLRQRTTIHLSAGAGLFWWDILAPGREASGEVFAYERVEVKTEVMALGRWVAVENMRLEPHRRDVTSLARLGPYRYCVAFYICRVGADSKFWITAEQHLREVATGLGDPPEALWAISTLPRCGLVIRGLTVHGRDAVDGVRTLWRAAKVLLYGREAILPRKIN